MPKPKPDGSIHICSDYKITFNQVLKVDRFSVPKAQDLFSTIAGEKQFTTLDLTNAYQQVVLEPSSRQYATINTHPWPVPIPFAVASAPAVFEQIME